MKESIQAIVEEIDGVILIAKTTKYTHNTSVSKLLMSNNRNDNIRILGLPKGLQAANMNEDKSYEKNNRGHAPVSKL